jgi:hypothetical protein
MAWSTTGAAEALGDATGTTLTALTRPTTTTNDMFECDVYLETNTPQTITFSNGTWALVEDNSSTGSTPDVQHLKYRSFYAGEGADFNISWDGSNIWRVAIVSVAFRGGSAAGTTFDGTPTANVGTSTTATILGVTLTTSDALVTYGVGTFVGDNKGLPSGTTPTFVENIELASLVSGYGIHNASGSAGNRTVTWSPNPSSAWSTIMAGYAYGAAAKKAKPPMRRQWRVWNRSVVW